MITLKQDNFKKRARFFTILLILGIFFTVISFPIVFSDPENFLFNFYMLFCSFIILFSSILMLTISVKARNRYNSYFDNNQTITKSAIASELNISEKKIGQELTFFAGSNKDARKTRKASEYQFTK